MAAEQNLLLEVDLYVDVTCPWCYLAHKRLTSALNGLASAPLPSRLLPAQTRIRVLPFFVNHKQRLYDDGTERPKEESTAATSPRVQKAVDPYEDEERKEKAARLRELAAQDGLVIRPPSGPGDESKPSSSSNPRRLPDTTNSHRLLRWIGMGEANYTYPAGEEGERGIDEGLGYSPERDERGVYDGRLQYRVLEELFRVQFEIGGNLEDIETIVQAAVKAGLSPQGAAVAKAFLETTEMRSSVLQSELFGRLERSVTGVPWYFFSVTDATPGCSPEDRDLISFELVGAQDKEAFERLLARAVMKGRQRLEKKYGSKV